MRIRSPDGGRRSGQSSHAIPGAKACPGWRRECRFLRFLGGLHRLDAEQGSLVGVRMTAECHPILLEPYTQPCWPNQVPGRRAAVKARPGGGAPGRAPPPSTADASQRLRTVALDPFAILLRRRPPTPDYQRIAAQAAALHARGRRVSAIADHFGVDHDTAAKAWTPRRSAPPTSDGRPGRLGSCRSQRLRPARAPSSSQPPPGSVPVCGTRN